jgi:Fe-S cluster biogenesis protein NfuA
MSTPQAVHAAGRDTTGHDGAPGPGGPGPGGTDAPGQATLDPAQVVSRIEELLSSLEEEAGPRVATSVEEVVRLLATLYGQALEHVLEALRAAGEPGGALLRRLAGDPLVSGLLVVHDLHPDDLATRVTEALETVRPYLGSHAGDVELVEVTGDDVVRLRLSGTCDGCPASSVTVTTTVETAIRERAPEVADIVVEGMADQGVPGATAGPATSGDGVTAGGGTHDGLPLLQIQPRPPQEAPLAGAPASPASPGAAAAGWVALEDGPDGGPVAGRVRTLRASGAPLAVTVLGEDVVAYRDACARCGGSLDGARVEGDVTTCPGCERRYDLRRAGRAEDGGPPLHPIPLLGGATADASADASDGASARAPDGARDLRVAAAALAGAAR